MKKFLGLLLVLSMVLAACGGLKGELDGNTYNFDLSQDGSSAMNFDLKFKGDKAEAIGKGESLKYEVEGEDKIILYFSEDKSKKVTLYDLKEKDGSYEGKAKMTEKEKDLPMKMTGKLTKKE
ncbi:hypothetical protein [Macrococcoides caseolyticum]|uniref:hypothetical protein n=1 Tax=Macrococcoides caseolyticum TaxID=69966 RepID=UPI001F3686E4|nr:hypothetical protein [Macrococcus caseolyticus]MCE4956023.1 hypothetical protein [Macrococcus caseolyticus]